MRVTDFVADTVHAIQNTSPTQCWAQSSWESRSLFEGAAGVALFLVEAAQLLVSAPTLRLVEQWCAYAEGVGDHLRDDLAVASNYPRITNANNSVLLGTAGAAYVRILASSLMGRERELRQAVDSFVAAWRGTKELAAGPPLELFSGAVGFACAAGDLFTRCSTMPSVSLDAIGRVRRESLARVVETLSEPLSTRQGVSTGFAHGLSAELFVCLDCAGAADVVEARLREFAELAVYQPPLIMWRARVGEAGFGPLPGSWCNGLAGNLLLFCRAAEILRSDYYGELAARIADTTFAVRSADASLCCGSSGQALALACYARLSGDRRFRKRARARLDQALARSHRLPLEKLWQGQVGIALTALRFTAGGGRFPVVESPTPTLRMHI